MSRVLKLWLVVMILMGCVSAAPEDFIKDPDGFRHGTYDRIYKTQVVYVDVDGTLLYQIGDKLSAGGRHLLEKIISFYPKELRAKLELRIYIHPKAKWIYIGTDPPREWVENK